MPVSHSLEISDTSLALTDGTSHDESLQFPGVLEG